MNVSEAQYEFRRGYMSGAPGVLASSLCWFAAAFTAWRISPEQSVWVLFIGGMLIYPVGLVIAKVLGASASASKTNPLAQLAIASTFWMIFALPLAYAISVQQLDWFFPAMLLIIGGRYLTFATLYGMNLFWALGLALAGAGFGSAVLNAPVALAAVTGAGIELFFALVLFGVHARSWRGQAA